MTFTVTKSPNYLAGKLLFEKRHEFCCFVYLLKVIASNSDVLDAKSAAPAGLGRPGCLDSGVFDRPAFSGHVFSWFLENYKIGFKKRIFV